MEKARIEATTAFKNVKLGQMINNPRKRKIHDSVEHKNSKKQNQITLTRIQKAKQEAEKAFENVSLDKIPPKRSKLEKEKIEKKLLEGKKEAKPSEVKKGSKKSPLPGSNPVLKSSKAPDKGSVVTEVRSVGVNTPKRLTRSQSAKMEAMKCYNSKGVEDIGGDESCKENVDRKLTKNHEEKSMDSDGVAIEMTHDNVSNITPQSHHDSSNNKGPGKNNGQKRLTRIERAKLEALQSFKGQEFSDICKQSTRIVAKHLKPKKDQSCNTENEELCNTPKHVPGLHNQDDLKHKESFQLKCVLLKGEIPTCKTTQHVHKQLKQKKTKVDFYSSIIEESFKDQSSLLETSRRIVKTAIELETPEGSPMSATTA